MTEPKLVHVETREAWRAWLEKHHATETEVWLVFARKHTGKPRVSYDAAVEEARQRRLQQAVGMLERNEKLGITPPPAR